MADAAQFAPLRIGAMGIRRLWIVYAAATHWVSNVHAAWSDNATTATPAARCMFMLDLAFLVLGVVLFGVTVAYASACDRT